MYTMGTSAYDLDRWGALPEIEIPAEPKRRERPPREVTAPPTEETREKVATRTRTREAKRQSVSVFGVLGCMVVMGLLLMIVLSHMQLALISSEMAQLEGQISSLRERGGYLQSAHESAFGLLEVERFAREELGMVDAVRGQMVFIGSGAMGDTAEVLRVEEESYYGLIEHMSGLIGILRESWSSIFGR